VLVVSHTGVVDPQLPFAAHVAHVFVVVSQWLVPHGVSSTHCTHFPVAVLHSVSPVAVQSALVRQVELLPCVTQVLDVVLQTWPPPQSLLASHCGQLHSTWMVSCFCPVQGWPNWRCGVGPCAVKSFATTLQEALPRHMF
jgi:hypothetical protein